MVRHLRAWFLLATVAVGVPGVARGRGEPASPAGDREEPTAAFGEVVDVALGRMIARVLDRDGEPALGLGPDDFELTADRLGLQIAAVDWVGSGVRGTALDLDAEPFSAASPEAAPPPPAPRLVVVFVQANFEPSRLRGHLRMLPYAERLLDGLGFDDQVAVVSFDSHLKLRQDFTRDLDLLSEALAEGIRYTPQGRWRRQAAPSLAAHLDPEEARRAASPERALELVARALAAQRGDRSLVYLGWGLGRFGAGGVSMTPRYAPARDLLQAAEIPVFVLDVTDADYHSLEVGLQQAAVDTGGAYVKTNLSPSGATHRIASLLAGYYVLSYRLPAAASEATLRLELRDRRGGRRIVR